MLLDAVLLYANAEVPNAVLFEPVVLNLSVVYVEEISLPTATLAVPVVVATPTDAPTNVFRPDVFAVPASYPTNVLLSAVFALPAA